MKDGVQRARIGIVLGLCLVLGDLGVVCAAYDCTTGGDHGGAAWAPATDCASGEVAGIHTGVGAFSIASSTTVTVKAYDGSTYGVFDVYATTISIQGTLTAAGKGFSGGAAGAAGSVGAGGAGGGATCGTASGSAGSLGTAGSDGSAGSGTYGGSAGGGGARAVLSGAGGLFGVCAVSGGSAGLGGVAAIAGSDAVNGGYLGLATNGDISTDAMAVKGSGGGGGGGGGGSSGGGGGGAANSVGASGGAGGASGAGGAGGAGGGAIRLFASSTLVISGTVSADGAAGSAGTSGSTGVTGSSSSGSGGGGTGGAGGAAGASGSAGSIGTCSGGSCRGGGGGGGGGGVAGGAGGSGAGGGVVIQSRAMNGLTISGTVVSRGGGSSTTNGGSCKVNYRGTAPSTSGLTCGRSLLTSLNSLSVDVCNESRESVSAPSYSMSSIAARFTSQHATGTLGTVAQEIVVTNSSQITWSLTIAPTSGATAVWTSGESTYDMNDSDGATDGVDADSVGGQLTIDPSTMTINAGTGCSASAITKGAQTSFVEDSVGSITLLSSSASPLDCEWGLTGIQLQQVIPVGQRAGSYTLPMTLTIS